MAERRTIVREHHFERDLISLFGSLEIGDDYVAGAEVLLSLEPEAGGVLRVDSSDGSA